MTAIRSGRLRAFLLVFAAFAVALLGLARPAGAASPSLPDPSRTGSITMHKFEAPSSPTGLPNNGTVVDTAGLTPMPGVTFSVQQVTGIDLTTNQGWQDASALSRSFNPANASGSITAAGHGLSAAAGSPVTTDSNGAASVGSLPLGLYLVTETSWPAGATPSAPFLVSVPLTDPSNLDKWIYDVNVYPKNAVTNVAKTVDDSRAIKLGDPVSWTITGDIPNVSTIDGYKIVDQLDPKLAYAGTTVSLADGTAITQGTDYTIAFDSATNTLSVVFTDAGRAVLAAHHATQVVVKVNSTVNAVGEIANSALLYPNQASFGVTPGEPGGPVVSPPVDTKWGGITVLKTDQNGNALSGAVFSVYTSQTDAQNGTNPVSINGQTTFTSGANGQVGISGLRYSDYANGQAVAPGDPGYQDYWLAEVTAPSGYELLASPVKFQVTSNTSTVGVDLTIKDVPSNAGFTLPFTGGPGGILVYAGGALLLAGALLVALTRRQRREVEAG